MKPEKSNTFEVSLSNKYHNLFSQITFFNSIIKDKIELVSYGSGNTKYYTSENLDEVDIKGIELSLDYDVTNNLDLGFNLTYLNTEDKSTGNELTFTPDVSASLNANYVITKDLNTNAMIRHIGKQYSDSSNTQELDSYNLVDIGVQYKINKSVEIYAGIDNLFDKEVEEELGSNVGRYYFTGIRATF